MKKNLKKVLATGLAASMVMSMTAFAGTVKTTNKGEDGSSTNSSIEVKDEQVSVVQNKLDVDPVIVKTYTVNSGTAPNEIFTYKFDPVSYKNGDGKVITYSNGQYTSADISVPSDFSIPAIENATTEFTGGTTTTMQDKIEVDIDAYELGVYTYKVTEVVPETLTAGVTYTDKPLYLVLTILRDEASENHYVAALHYETETGTKEDAGFTNSYDSGSLAITKQIVGNMADMDKEFAFTVTFEAPESEVINSTIETDTEDTERAYESSYEDGVITYTFMLGDNETATFTNLPEGTIYTVTEEAENYTSDNGVWSDTGRTISKNDADTVTFTNTLTNEIDTGISLDSMPYLMTLALSAFGALGFAGKKRKEEDEI